MPGHLTNLDLLLGALVLILGFVFALAASFEMRESKKPPFLNYFDSEYERSLFRNGLFSQPDDAYPDRKTYFQVVQDNEFKDTDWPPR
jgi:hypothetical protein